MIRINGLKFAYPGMKGYVLNGIELEIEKGDFIAIMGSNGSGKSTLCKAINGLIPHFFDGDYSGSVEVCGLNTVEHDISELAMKVGYVYQDFENQIVRPTVLDDASFSCLNYAMSDYRERGMRALEAVGLENKASDYIWQLSGGQKHLLALAGALALNPEVLILDEPASQLDPLHAKGIYEALKILNSEFGKTIITIEHHTEYIAKYCKNAVLLDKGRVIWKLLAKQALSRVDELADRNIFPPQTAIAAKILMEKGILRESENLPVTVEDGVDFFSQIKIPEASDMKKPFRIFLNPPKAVCFENVSVEYRGIKDKNSKIFDGLDLNIYKGEKVALIGSNGAGKSTLLKLACGFIKPCGGRIYVCGEEITSKKPEETAKYVSLVYQNPEEMFIGESVGDDIEYAMRERKIPDYKSKALELIEMFSLKGLENKDARLLSGGQMRRASLAIGIALNPSVLLLDEPTANLDIATRTEVIEALNSICSKTETAIVATHDMQLVAEWADRVIVLHEGRIAADGTCTEIFEDEFVLEKVGIMPPEIYTLGKRLFGAQTLNPKEFADLFLREREEVLAI